MSAIDDDRDLVWAVDLFVDRLAEFVEDPVAVVESGGCGLGDGRLITAAELIEIARDEEACD